MTENGRKTAKRDIPLTPAERQRLHRERERREARLEELRAMGLRGEDAPADLDPEEVRAWGLAVWERQAEQERRRRRLACA